MKKIKPKQSKNSTTTNPKLFFESSWILPIILNILALFIAKIATDFGIHSSWWVHLKKPFFQPPSILFAPVWTVLYIINTYIGYSLLKQKNISFQNNYYLQLFLNAIWSWIFFVFKQPFLSSTILILLLGSIAFNAYGLYHQKNKLLAYCYLPYAMWLSFATLLNLWIFFNN